MKDRLLKFLEEESLTAAKFADEIGVQRSSISHILSGRNNPGYDFFQKVLKRYPHLNAEWLLLGSGKMTKPAHQASLFNLENGAKPEKFEKAQLINKSESNSATSEESAFSKENSMNLNPEGKETTLQKKIEKIVILYTDQSFVEYKPSKA
jgi:transcriptional regulator with XRE-family HTH domain